MNDGAMGREMIFAVRSTVNEMDRDPGHAHEATREKAPDPREPS